MCPKVDWVKIPPPPPPPLHKNSITNPLFLFDGFPTSKSRRSALITLVFVFKMIYNRYLIFFFLGGGKNVPNTIKYAFKKQKLALKRP